MKKDIRNHPYHFEQALQRQSQKNNTDNIIGHNSNHHHHTLEQQQKNKNTTYFTWLVFMNTKWVPFDATNQGKLEQTLHLGGTFVDIEDSNFPKVKRVRVFPKSNYLSYLGVKFRLSRIMQPDAWVDAHHCPSSASLPLTLPSSSSVPVVPHTTSSSSSSSSSSHLILHNDFNQTLTRFLPYPIRNNSSVASSSSSTVPPSTATSTTTNSMDHWRTHSPGSSSHTLISHVLS